MNAAVPLNTDRSTPDLSHTILPVSICNENSQNTIAQYFSVNAV